MRQSALFKRMLAAIVAAASLCTAGCANDVSSELPDSVNSQSIAENGIFNLENNTENRMPELPDAGYTQNVYEKYVPIDMNVNATPEPAVSYPGVSYIYPQEWKAYATDSSIYMRVSADNSTDDDNIVKKVEDAWAEQFFIVGKTDDWYFARYTEDGMDYMGFVRMSDFYTGSAAPTPTPEPTNKPKKTPKPDKDNDKKEDKKDNDDKDSKSEPASTPKPVRKKTPYSGKYQKVSLKYEKDSQPITFTTTTFGGDTVSESVFARNSITMITMWTQT